MNKLFYYFLLFVFPLSVHAGANFRSASVSPSSVNTGDGYTLTVSMNGNGSHWYSTSVTVNGQTSCFNNVFGNNKTRSYTLTAPSTVNNYNISVSVHDRRWSCSGNASSGSTNLVVTASPGSSSHSCAAVWPSELNPNFSGNFNPLQSPNSASPDFSLNQNNNFSAATGVLVYDEFIVENANLSFSGTDPVTIYANKVRISLSNVNQHTPNPLIIIADDVEITGSNVQAAMYITSASSTIQTSSIFGAIASPNNLVVTYDNTDANDNNLYYDTFYFDHQNIGSECSAQASNATYLDRFNTASYSNNDGSVNWDSDWVETNDDNHPSFGNIRITQNRLLLSGTNKRITRSVDLSAYISATLTFNYRMQRSDNNGGRVFLEARDTSNTSNQWIQLGRFDIPSSGSQTSISNLSVDLEDYGLLNSNLKLRFRANLNGNFFSVDDFAINAVPRALTCPNTSTYSTIFSDNFQTDQSHWTGVDLPRSTSVFPNQSVVNDTSEDQDLDFSISNGLLRIEGDSVEEDNEYGVVLHDLSADNYDISDIQEYSIEADMYAPIGNAGYLNNDVGIVFGYEDDRNFYLVKWTKYGNRFSFSNTYPGIHKSLDLVRVSNGSATLLDSISDYDAPYPAGIKITVNSDGITICFDGADTLFAAGARPAIEKFGFFSYENEEGVAFDNMVVKCNGCSQVSQVDHYRIVHPTTGLTCSTHSVSVFACTDSSCSSYLMDPVTANVTKTYGGNTSTILNVNTSSGTANGNFNHLQSGDVTFALTNAAPAASSPTKCYTGSVTGIEVPSCRMTLGDSGFLVSTVPDFESAIGWQQVEVQAVTKDSSIAGSCAPSFAGDKQINLLFEYETPSSPADNTVQLQFTESNASGSAVDASPQTSKALTPGAASSKTLNFSNTNATARFFVDYFDVGRLRLTVSDATTGSGLIADSESFVVYPSELTIGLSDENNDYLGAVDNPTHVAGQPFNLAISAWNAKDEIVRNYQPGGIELAATMLAPIIDLAEPVIDRASEVSFKYSSAASINANNTANNWQSAQAAIGNSFANTGYTFNAASFDNVGTFAVDVRDSNYFTHTINASEVTAGRFTPYYFVVTEQTQGQLQATGTGYSYIGEELSYATDPVIQFLAQTYTGQVATNYGGFGKTGSTFNFAATFAARSYRENGVNTGFDEGFSGLTAGTVSYSLNDNYDGAFTATLSGDRFIYDKAITPTAPFNSNITLTLAISDLRDGDGIGRCSKDVDDNLIDPTCPGTYQSFSMNFLNSPELRYGRLLLGNASSGSANDNLYVPFSVEYWNNGRFITNTDDSVTDFSAITGSLKDSNGDDVTSFTLGVTGSTVVNGLPRVNEGIFVPVQADGEYSLELSGVPAWLNIDWDGSTVIDNNDSPSGTIIFGSFSGNKRIIYKRER